MGEVWRRLQFLVWLKGYIIESSFVVDWFRVCYGIFFIMLIVLLIEKEVWYLSSKVLVVEVEVQEVRLEGLRQNENRVERQNKESYRERRSGRKLVEINGLVEGLFQ